MDTIVINPYVTSRGGVVILNGPFPIDQAHRVAALCKAAPDLLQAAEWILECDAAGLLVGGPESDRALKAARAAIAKARPA